MNQIKFIGNGIQQYQVEVVEVVGKQYGFDVVKVKVADGQDISDYLKNKIESTKYNINELSDHKEF